MIDKSLIPTFGSYNSKPKVKIKLLSISITTYSKTVKGAKFNSFTVRIENKHTGKLLADNEFQLLVNYLL